MRTLFQCLPKWLWSVTMVHKKLWFLSFSLVWFAPLLLSYFFKRMRLNTTSGVFMQPCVRLQCVMFGIAVPFNWSSLSSSPSSVLLFCFYTQVNKNSNNSAKPNTLLDSTAVYEITRQLCIQSNIVYTNREIPVIFVIVIARVIRFI